MRRRSDSWLNATQILKVAGVDKGKRTKVLEKEILSGEHEKVQGGYGRYQGTWINYKRGREFCRAYGVEDVLRPLLEYDMGQDGTQPGKGSIETPTKEQAMAAQRKKMMYNGTGADNRSTLQTPNTTFFQNISPIAANAVNAINKARFDSPGERPASGTKRPASVRKTSSQQINSQESQYPGGSQQSMQSDVSLGMDSLYGNRSTPYFANVNRSQSNLDQEPPRKRAKPSLSADPFSYANGDYDRSMRETTPTEPNESFIYPGFIHPTLENGVMGLQPLPTPASNSALEKQSILASLFLDPTRDDLNDVSGLDTLSEEDFDIPIDNGAHTALHWAASLAKPSLLKALISKGASIYRVNGGGETALMRAARTTNNLDQSSFPELLELLGPTIEMRDNRGQTVLHHIAVTSAIKGRSSACRYYLDSLLEFVVRQGSASNSQQDSFKGDPSQNKHKPIGLARFMSEIVNAQDIAGDTALNLAARINNRSIIQQLLEVGANPSIPNRGGLKPLDFGVGSDLGLVDLQNSGHDSLSSSQKTTSENRVGDSSKQLLDCKTVLYSRRIPLMIGSVENPHYRHRTLFQERATSQTVADRPSPVQTARANSSTHQRTAKPIGARSQDQRARHAQAPNRQPPPRQRRKARSPVVHRPPTERRRSPRRRRLGPEGRRDKPAAPIVLERLPDGPHGGAGRLPEGAAALARARGASARVRFAQRRAGGAQGRAEDEERGAGEEAAADRGAEHGRRRGPRGRNGGQAGGGHPERGGRGDGHGAAEGVFEEAGGGWRVGSWGGSRSLVGWLFVCLSVMSMFDVRKPSDSCAGVLSLFGRESNPCRIYLLGVCRILVRGRSA